MLFIKKERSRAWTSVAFKPGLKHNLAHMPSLNLTPNLPFEHRLCMFLINGYYTRSKLLQSLNFLTSLCSGDFPFKLCHRIIIMKEFLLESCIIIFTKVVYSLIIPVKTAFTRYSTVFSKYPTLVPALNRFINSNLATALVFGTFIL